jgi:hypothetical protein
MADEGLGALNRRARRRRLLAIDAACACGESDPAVLIREGERLLCVRCRRSQTDRPTWDWHHPLGAANAPVALATDVNLHALFSDRQHDWPTDTLTNPRESPYRRYAAAIRATLDFVAVYGPVLRAAAETLESLDPWIAAPEPEPGCPTTTSSPPRSPSVAIRPRSRERSAGTPRPPATRSSSSTPRPGST